MKAVLEVAQGKPWVILFYKLYPLLGFLVLEICSVISYYSSSFVIIQQAKYRQ